MLLRQFAPVFTRPVTAFCLSCSLVGIAALALTGWLTSSPSPPAVQETGWNALALPARLAVSRDLGDDRRQFSVARAPGGMLVASGSGVSAAFGVGDVTVRATSGGSLRLGLSAIGRGQSLPAMAAVRPHLSGSNRVSYQHPGAASEWYANGPLGLEQGFSLVRRPAGSGPLTLVVGELSPTARARLGKSDSSLTLLGPTGRSLLTYGELSVSDASGRHLRASIAVNGKELLLRVDDSGARYPLRIDPTVQDVELSAGDGAAHDGLGFSVAVSGDTIVAGAPSHKVLGNAQQGAAYVFTEPPSGWANATQTAELTSGDGTPQDDFGSSVAVDGNTIVVGAPGHNAGQGVAYVFTKPGSGGWTTATQTAELIPNDGTGGDQFGQSVAVSGTTVVVGSPVYNEAKGAVYEFTEPPSGVWVNASQTAELTANNAVAQDQLGSSVAIDGPTIVAGAEGKAAGSNPAEGAAYVFSRPSSGVWGTTTQTAELTASDGASYDAFGASVAVSGGTIAIGAPEHQPSSGVTRGAVYVFTMPSGGWSDANQTAELTGTNFPLGESVAVDGETIVTGESAATQEQVLYEFTEPASGGWQNSSVAAQLIATDASDNDTDGWYNVAVSGTTIVVGAPGHSPGGSDGQGLVYAFSPGGSSAKVDPTSTSVVCAPSPLSTASVTTCTASVTDGATSGSSTATGNVSFQAAPGTGAFASSASCSLAATSVSGTSGCSVTFTPSTSGSYTITATYGGDSTHDSSVGSVVLTATPAAAAASGSGSGSAGTATTTTTAPAAGTIQIASRVDVSLKGVAKVPLSCKAATHTSCSGRLTVTASAKTRVRRKVSGHKRYVEITRVLKLGSANYRLGSGDSAALSMQLSKAAMKLFRSARKHTLTAKATAKPGVGQTTARTITMIESRNG